MDARALLACLSKNSMLKKRCVVISGFFKFPLNFVVPFKKSANNFAVFKKYLSFAVLKLG